MSGRKRADQAQSAPATKKAPERATARGVPSTKAEPEPEPEADVSPLLLTVEQAARKLGICRDFMYRLLARPHPEVRSVKLGRARRVPVSELEAYIARRLSEVA